VGPFVLVAGLCTLAAVAGCGSAGPASTPTGGADLSGFTIAHASVDDVPLALWLAEDPAQQERGLMFASAEQVAPLPDGTLRGMIFLFPVDVVVAITMRDTYVPLDVVFLSADGLLLEIHPRQPLDTSLVVPAVPIRYVLEVPVGLLAARGVGIGDRLLFGADFP
jgi:uncharacterized membrane protein (UPF0127 family)